MTTLQIYDRVYALVDMPDFGVKRGAAGTIVDLHPGGAFEVDFGLDADGNIISIGVEPDQLSPVSAEIALAA